MTGIGCCGMNTTYMKISRHGVFFETYTTHSSSQRNCRDVYVDHYEQAYYIYETISFYQTSKMMKLKRVVVALSCMAVLL